jgi:histidine kinase
VSQGRGDRYELLLVMLNLLANAVAYSEPGGAVSVSVRAEGELLRFAVSDEGPGIPAHVLPDLFTPFYLIRDVGRRNARGTGLGLCSAKHLVEASGGRIWVESRMGEGTAVLFDVPAAQ